MKASDALAWFEEIAKREVGQDVKPGATRLGGGAVFEYRHGEASQWITEAESALRSVYPQGHAVMQRWMAIFFKDTGSSGWSTSATLTAAKGVFQSARDQLKAGRISSLVDGIKAETLGDLLDQADLLVSSRYVVAAMVVAGGALETFLKHLCERNALVWQGPGSINAYASALAQARNSGTEVVSATDTKLITGWGGMRNDAAHSPAQFNRSEEEVRIVVSQIRNFVARHS